MSKELWERDFYTNPNIDYLISKRIMEYDMKDAGFNLIKYYDLLPKKDIKYLSSISKSDRKIQIGLYQRSDKDLAKKLTKSFAMMRKIFFNANSISDEDVIAIKKDAIFIIGKEFEHVKFNNVEFVQKHKYTSYHKFGNIEMYYRDSNSSLDIKGIRDGLLIYHEEYFMKFLKRIFRYLEYNEQRGLIRYIKKFNNKYLNRELDIKYYRELSPDSVYSFNNEFIGNSKYFKAGIMYADEYLINKVDISYNYKNYILPIMQRFYFNRK